MPLSSLSESFGIEDYIEFTGIINHTKVKEFLYIADVCIAPDLPNGLNEYLTLVKILEYMKCSRAFVAFDLKETVDFAGDAGLYAVDTRDFVNKIEFLIKNPEIEKEMGLKGNSIIKKNYLWSHSEENLLHMYEKLV